jgi:phosphoserine phosphatase
MMKYRLVLFDVDSTLIEQEVIDLLAKRTPSAQQVADITERAMRGEIDFDQALTERVALLAGLSEQIFTDVLSEISFTAGALDLLHELRSRGVAIGVVSGGFHNVLDNLFADFNLDLLKANVLEVENGSLTGKVQGEIVNRAVKAQSLASFAQKMAVNMDETVAIGDGSNDISMIQTAGLGISFCGKPILEQAADVTIQERNLLRVLDYLN